MRVTTAGNEIVAPQNKVIITITGRKKWKRTMIIMLPVDHCSFSVTKN